MLLNLLRGLASSCRGTRRNVEPEHVEEAKAWIADRLLAQGRLHEAEQAYRARVDANPSDADALCGLGVVAAGRSHFSEAAAYFEAACRLAPTRTDALIGLGNVYRELERLDEAIARLEQAHQLMPHSPAAGLSLSRALREAGRASEALPIAAAAFACHPQDAELALELGLAQADLGQDGASRQSIVQAIALNAEFTEAHLAFAFALLAAGRFSEGWEEYEWRLPVALRAQGSETCSPEWDGAYGSSQSLLILADQGLGDQLMFASCLPEVLSRVAHCTLACDGRLMGLMQRSFPQLEVVASSAFELPAAALATRSQACVSLASLPRFFRRELADFPAHGGYLQAETLKVAHWKRRLDALGNGLKVGISWRGGLRQTRRAARSLSLMALGNAVNCQGNAVLIDLQYGDTTVERSEFERRSGVQLHHWDEALEAYDETAALVCALDLVVSVCTSVVHLAGALGRPVWVLTPAVAEWRYQRHGSAMPWYPSARLFRQTASGEWSPPLEQVVDGLQVEIGLRVRRHDPKESHCAVQRHPVACPGASGLAAMGRSKISP